MKFFTSQQKVRQVLLERDNNYMVVWVDASLKLKSGVLVTGKDKVTWKVCVVYNAINLPELINSDWEVGGL